MGNFTLRRRRIWIAMASVVAFLSCTFGVRIFLQGVPSAVGQHSAVDPNLVDPNETIEVNLGDHPPGEQIMNVAQIRNMTNTTRVIGEVDRSCSCIKYEISDTKIGPFESVELRAKYITPSMRGPFKQTMVINYKDTDAKTTVKFFGTVGYWAILGSDRIQMPDVIVGGTSTIDYVLSTREPWPPEHRAIEVSLPEARVSFADEGNDRQRIRCHIEFTPTSCAQTTVVRGELILRWISEQGRILRIPVTARVHPVWSSEPDNLHFGVCQKGENRTEEVTINVREESDREIGEVSIRHNLDPCFTVTHDRDATTGKLHVSVSLKTEAALSGKLYSGTIDVHDRLQDKSEIVRLQIPVAAYVR